MKSLVIEAALNGGRSQKEHADVPVTPEEVGQEARRCMDAGASVVHFHAQDAAGVWSSDPGWYREAIQFVRIAAPDILVSITSIRPEHAPVGAILDVLDVVCSDPLSRPDLMSVNLGHIVAWPRQAGTGRLTEHFPNAYADIVEVLAACAIAGIVPELGVMDLGFISNAATLRSDGIVPDDAWFLVELDSPGWGSGRQTAPAVPGIYDVLANALAEQFPTARWAAHGADVTTWGVVERALERGAHVRVGFEDTLVMPDGRLATSNAEQVAWVVARARLLGREPATSEQTRSIVGLS